MLAGYQVRILVYPGRQNIWPRARLPTGSARTRGRAFEMRINFDDFNKGVRTAFDQRMRVQRVRKLRNIFRASSHRPSLPKPALAAVGVALPWH